MGINHAFMMNHITIIPDICAPIANFFCHSAMAILSSYIGFNDLTLLSLVKAAPVRMVANSTISGGSS